MTPAPTPRRTWTARFLAAAAALFFVSAASAVTIPLLVNFQGKLLDATTNAPKNGSVTFQFRILDAAGGGSVLWGPENQTLTVTNGVFSAQLGSVLALSTDVFAGGNAYLSVVASPDTYPAGEMLPRQQLVASPYAITAQQLASVGGVRVNAGVTYSTFTSGGDLQVDNGLNASTGVFTGTGSQVYSLTASSGVQINAGTLDFNGGSIDASGSGISAATGTFLATGNNQYSLYTSSGVSIGAGMLDSAGSANFKGTGNAVYSMTLSSGLIINGGMLDFNGKGIDARGSEVLASTFTGSGANLTGVTPQVSDSSVTVTAALTANTEAIVISTNITPATITKSLLLLGKADVVTNATAGTCFLRIRVNLAGACTTASTPIIFAETYKIPATANGTHTVDMTAISQYSPASTANGSYCLTVQCTTTYTRSNGHLSIVAGAP